MKTRVQHAYEALYKRLMRMQAAALESSDPHAVAGMELISKRHSSDWEPVLAAYEKGQPFPKRRYQSASEKEEQRRKASAARRPRTRFLAHPARPSETVEGAFEIDCQREGCKQIIVTKRKQRRYCSESCRREVARLRYSAERAELEAVTIECAAKECRARVFQLRPDHRFCSTPCRSASRVPRERISHTPRQCGGCGEAFTPKTNRAKFCSDRCRVRTWDRRKADRNADTKPIPIIR